MEEDTASIQQVLRYMQKTQKLEDGRTPFSSSELTSTRMGFQCGTELSIGSRLYFQLRILFIQL